MAAPVFPYQALKPMNRYRGQGRIAPAARAIAATRANVRTANVRTTGPALTLRTKPDRL